MNEGQQLQLILANGEGYKSEFKEGLSNLDREIVAFANSSGGNIYIGISDKNEITGINVSNKIKSQIQDIARNCDPTIKIEVNVFSGKKVIEVKVQEGHDKPYRCKDGFFLRVGPSSQKLRRNEILDLVNHIGKVRFDEAINDAFDFNKDFSKERFERFLYLCGIDVKAKIKDLLVSLNIAYEVKSQIKFTNAGVLFFAKDPQRFFPESFITCVKYGSNDRYSILDNKDFKGSLIEQIELALSFTSRHISTEQRVAESSGEYLGVHTEISEYPLKARREAIINAVTHRDYFYDSSHIYIHMFPDHMDIENPGGLPHGMTKEMLGDRSVRRNRLIADLLHRAHYINRVDSGFDRMRRSLKENANPPLKLSLTNFFNVRFYKRIDLAAQHNLTDRQWRLYRLIDSESDLQKRTATKVLNVSEDTALRELNVLIDKSLIKRVGVGRGVKYVKK